jgi:hypothetical protein
VATPRSLYHRRLVRYFINITLYSYFTRLNTLAYKKNKVKQRGSEGNTLIPLSIVGNSKHKYGDIIGEKQSNEIGDLMGTDNEHMGRQEDSAGLMTLDVLLVTGYKRL